MKLDRLEMIPGSSRYSFLKVVVVVCADCEVCFAYA
jgi:hypothetical protein